MYIIMERIAGYSEKRKILSRTQVVHRQMIHSFSSGESFFRSSSQSLTLELLSAGFDASEYETPSMSRHNRKVPTTFFYHFTRDVCAFANKWAKGRIVSVLEGGYSDKALLSGAMAHLTGLVDGESSSGKDDSREPWWSSENVQMVRGWNICDRLKTDG
jgi:hypothetical protein